MSYFVPILFLASSFIVVTMTTAAEAGNHLAYRNRFAACVVSFCWIDCIYEAVLNKKNRIILFFSFL